MYTYTHAHTNIYIYIYMYIYIYIIYMRMYIYIYVCVYIYMCLYIALLGIWDSNIGNSSTLRPLNRPSWILGGVNKWEVVKIMVPFGFLSIIRHPVFRGPKGSPSF